jgi:copper transport protein
VVTAREPAGGGVVTAPGRARGGVVTARGEARRRVVTARREAGGRLAAKGRLRRPAPAARAWAALAVAVLALALAPAAASAHATLESTVPARGAQLAKAPAQVEFHFDEAVEAAFGALRVFDSQGRPVQEGDAFHPDGDGSHVAVRLKPGLKDGTYTATYRVISADGHPVSSGFVFSVGDAGPAGKSVDSLLAGESTGPITDSAFAVVRAVQYAAIALGLGTLAFLLLCWLPALRAVAGGDATWQAASDAFAARAQRILAAAGIAGLLSGAAALVLQGAVGQGSAFWDALKPDVVDEVLGTRFGTAWGLGAVAWAVVLGALAIQRPLPRLQPASVGATGLALPSPRVAALALPLLALAFLPAMGGHASVQSPVALLLGANVLHVLAMSAWLGGIAMLALALRAATARLDPADRGRLLAATVSRFSSVAGIAIAVLLATGVVQGIVEVRTFAHLLDTAFGRAVLIKIAVALAIVALGAFNRQRLLPALRSATTPGRAGVLLRRTLRAELLLGLTALGATGALSTYAPSIAMSSGPYATSAVIGPARLEVTVDPAKVGPNQLHLYLFDRKTGAPFDRTKEIRVTAALPGKGIAPIAMTPHVAGPGHFVVDGATLAVKGKWTLTVVDRVSDFDEYQTRFTAPIE